MSEWQPITEGDRDDGSEVVVRLKNSHPRMPASLMGKSIHQIGTWREGDLWVAGVKAEDAIVEGIMPLPKRKSK